MKEFKRAGKTRSGGGPEGEDRAFVPVKSVVWHTGLLRAANTISATRRLIATKSKDADAMFLQPRLRYDGGRVLRIMSLAAASSWRKSLR